MDQPSRMREKLTQKQQIDEDESDKFIDFPVSTLMSCVGPYRHRQARMFKAHEHDGNMNFERPSLD
jgi:hypothetical protein